MSAELSNLELGLELELNSDDVAAAEAAVAADGESLTCSCCDLELIDKDSLHLHQISQHSLVQLSIALLALRGLDVSTGLGAGLPQDLCGQDTDSESTVSAHSSFMFGFTEEFNNTVPQNGVPVAAVSRQTMSAPANYACEVTPSSLPNIPQYTSNFPGSLNYGANNRSVENYDVDINRNHQKTDDLPIKIGTSGTDMKQSASVKCFLTNVNGMAKRSDGGADQQAALFHSFHGVEETLSQLNKNQENQKKRPQATQGNAANLSTPKLAKLTCSKNAPREDAKQSTNEFDGKEFRCEVCGRKYKRKSHLGRHIRMHSGVRPFPCTLCDKRFAVRSILKQHMRVHTGERPFKCTFCFQRFPQKSGLVTHMMLHTGKPYKCDLCDKSFVSNHKLSVHKKAHEEQSGRWPAMGPHSCPTCSTRFFTSSALAEHAKVHVVSIDDAMAPAMVSALASALASARREPTALSDISGSPNAEVITHNSQEVTAGQALLTLMDSNGVQEDPAMIGFAHGPRGDGSSKETRRVSGSDTDGSEVPIHFEFCDVPLDLKSSIYLKEECFEFEDKLPNGRLSDSQCRNTGS